MQQGFRVNRLSLDKGSELGLDFLVQKDFDFHRLKQTSLTALAAPNRF